MNVLYFCASWGLDHLDMEPMISKIKTAGFDGLETDIPFEKAEREKLKALLDKYDLEIIAHEYLANGKTINIYIKNFEKSLENAASFKPLFINSHTGRDFWTFEDNTKILQVAERFSENNKIKITHETHRGRCLYSAPMAKLYFNELPKLKINFDISHWCCVSESLLEAQQDTVSEAIKRTEHIHARVGHAQGPQISDPDDEFWKTETETFFNWWQKIYDRFVREHRDILTITPEFGAAPYTSSNPDTGEPLNDFFENNCKMKNLLKERFK